VVVVGFSVVVVVVVVVVVGFSVVVVVVVVVVVGFSVVVVVVVVVVVGFSVVVVVVVVVVVGFSVVVVVVVVVVSTIVEVGSTTVVVGSAAKEVVGSTTVVVGSTTIVVVGSTVSLMFHSRAGSNSKVFDSPFFNGTQTVKGSLPICSSLASDGREDFLTPPGTVIGTVHSFLVAVTVIPTILLSSMINLVWWPQASNLARSIKVSAWASILMEINGQSTYWVYNLTTLLVQSSRRDSP